MTPLTSMCRGLAVDREGRALGPPMMLVQRVNLGYRCVEAAETTKSMRTMFEENARLDRLSAALADVAQTLARGDLVKAQLLALCVLIEVCDDEQLARLAALRDLMEPGFDPKQPRDMSEVIDLRKKPVEVPDDNGREVLGQDGKPMR